MAKSALNLQDSFLNQMRKDNTEVKILMTNGTTLTGYVRGFDNFTVVLSSEGKQHLIYKHAISEIVAPKDSRYSHPSTTSNEKKKNAFNPIDLSRVQVNNSKE
ncbi:MAG: RNA chaperone Hfq [Candidatus Sumerlaeia bacterium]|nr:RNA chaperone Hfq [Candidatus Sumerlaeia bacterium]